MSFDFESGLGGGISGLFIGILTAIGLKTRVDKLEDKKQDKSLCDSIHKGIDEKFDRLIIGQDKIWQRLDTLNDYIRNKGVEKR